MNFSKHALAAAGVVVMSVGALLFAQAGDAAKVMADMRQALGGDTKLSAVKTLTATGKTSRAMGEQSMVGDYELAMELPDKYMTKQVAVQTPMGAMSVISGFNGDALIQDTEMPQQAAGMRMSMSFGGATPNATPEEKAAANARSVAANKQEFAKLALGMFGASFAQAPLEFSYGGTAEAPDGKADIINVKGPGDLVAKLFVDQKSHLPLMLSWMAKAPIQMTSIGPGGRAGAPGGAQVMTFGGGGGARGGSVTPEARDKLMKDMQAQMAEAEAKRKTVEFRMFYGDYQGVDGVQLPHRIQQSIDGTAATEITIEKYKINPKIDPKKFDTVKEP